MHYTEGHYYHVYNRGAHKELIFFEKKITGISYPFSLNIPRYIKPL